LKLAIIIQTEPCTYEDFGTAYEILRTAADKGHEVRLFLYDDAVVAANKNAKMTGKRPVNKMVRDLAERKVPIIACGACCMFRGITSDMLAQGTEMGGLTDLAEMIQWADRLLNFAH
jgi:sulfur relay (sulfurtransferase) complex TusBCD TusD component (DsrE family)